MTTTVPRVVVDDHPMFREGLVTCLSGDVAEVVGQAATGEEAVEVVRRTDPDVVLMDLHMPGIGGIEATRRIAEACPRVAVLVLTMLADDESVKAALRAGARGYLLKESSPSEIRQAVDTVMHGSAVFGAGVADRVLAAASSTGRDRPSIDGLTEREDEVLGLLARGLTNAEIAARAYLSEKTVRNYVSILFTKLGVSDRAAAVARARDAGYGGAGSSGDGPGS